MAIVPDPITEFDRTTPNDGDLFGEEFAQLYANDADLEAQITAIKPPKGTISGGLIFNSTTLPPTIRSGQYEVNGVSVNLTSNASLALADVIGSSLQTLNTYSQYLVLINSAGTKKYIMYGEGGVAGASGNITSIAESPSGTYTLTVATGTVGAYTNKVLVLTDGATTIYSGKITGGNGSTTIVFPAPTGVTFPTAGTWTVYERVTTLHGTGSATAITTDANVLKYTPSYGTNGWSAGTAGFSTSLNGFYMSLLGLTGYRVIGNFRTDASGNVITDVVSHQSGSIKNDNFWDLNTAASLVTNSIRWTNIVALFGNDYLFTDDGSNGSVLLWKSSGNFNSTFIGRNNGTDFNIAQTAVVTNTIATNNASYYNVRGLDNYATTNNYQGKANATAQIKPLADVIETAQPITKWYGTLTV